MLLKRLRFSVALFAAGMAFSANAQTDLGAECGCPPVASRPLLNLSTKADVDGNLTSVNTVLSCDTIYAINDKIYVGDGKTLTIAPGTLFKSPQGPAGDANALIVSRGGKIFAPGTKECPIVFTGSADPMDGTYGINNRGKWGGVVLLGKARNSLVANTGGSSTTTDGVGFIEGFLSAEPRNLYGMPPGTHDDNDNSGIMTYVSIRHAGDITGPANELNGLTLGSVGRGTTLQHIEVVSNADDGIEFFGGSVDLKYGSVLFNDDDGFDWDQGWSGRGQFWVVVKTDNTTAGGGDNGFECDGDDADQATFYASPKIYNATFIGAKAQNGSATADKGSALELKEGTRGEIRNCILANYTDGTTFYEDGAAHGGVGDTYDQWVAGNLIVENNTFINCTNFLKSGSAGLVLTPADTAAFLADGNTKLASLAGLSPVHVMNVTNNTVTTKHDLIPGADVSTSTLPPVNFFTPANYRGAFKSGEKSWLSDYTVRALIGLEGNLGECDTDINTDGTTNTNDFLLLLGAFNTNCQ